MFYVCFCNLSRSPHTVTSLHTLSLHAPRPIENGSRSGIKALILRAGQVSRLRPLTESRPKCLIELSGRSLLEWQLLALRRAGIDEVVIVTGFAAEQVEAMLALHTPSGMRVRTV